MAWNKEKIENTLNELAKRILITTEEPLLSSLKQDFEALLSVTKIIGIDTYQYRQLIPPSKMNFKIHQDFKLDSANVLFDKSDSILKLVRLIEESKIRAGIKLFLKKIPMNIQIDMVKEFFSTFDKGHFDLLESLMDDNIYFSSKKGELSRSLGKCIHIEDLRESFIIVDAKKKLIAPTLAHEVAHAYEFSLLPEYKNRMNWHFSTFVECYPRFVEFLILDHFMDSENKKLLVEYKRELFDALNIVIENYSGILSDSQEYNSFSHKVIDSSGREVFKKNVDYIVADLVAIYMLNLYKNDRDEYEKFIREYHSFKGISDSQIWSLFSIEDLENAYKEERLVLRRNLFSKKK